MAFLTSGYSELAKNKNIFAGNDGLVAAGGGVYESISGMLAEPPAGANLERRSCQGDENFAIYDANDAAKWSSSALETILIAWRSRTGQRGRLRLGQLAVVINQSARQILKNQGNNRKQQVSKLKLWGLLFV